MGKDTKIGLLVGVLVVVLFALVFFGGGGPSDENRPPEAVTRESAVRPADAAVVAHVEPADRVVTADHGSDPVRTETARTETARADTGTTDIPITEPRRTDAARTDTVTTDRERTDAVRTDTGRTDIARADTGRTDSARTDTGRTDVSWLDAFRRGADRVVTPAPGPVVPVGAKTYEVKPNDSYYKIAKAEYGNAALWPIIKAANNNLDPLPQGRQIIIPPKPASTAATDHAAPGPVVRPSLAADEYEVKSSDTLWKIAAAHFGNGAKYLLIYEANKDKLPSPEARLTLGMRLRLPPKDSAAAARSTPAPAARTASTDAAPAARSAAGPTAEGTSDPTIRRAAAESGAARTAARSSDTRARDID